MAISMLKIRRPLGRLIFNMGIAIPGKTVFLIETAPSLAKDRQDSCWLPCVKMMMIMMIMISYDYSKSVINQRRLVILKAFS